MYTVQRRYPATISRKRRHFSCKTESPASTPAQCCSTLHKLSSLFSLLSDAISSSVKPPNADFITPNRGMSWVGLSKTRKSCSSSCTSWAAKYPVLEEMYTGIPSASNTSRNVSSHPLAVRSRITMSPYLAGRSIPVAGSVT